MEEDHLNSTEQGTIVVAVNRCLMTFQVCILQAATIHPREMSMIEDQLAGLYTWARGIGVFAPARLSLDHRLRHAPEVHNVVNGLLESLKYRIENCSDSLKLLDGSLKTDSISQEDSVFTIALRNIASEISRLNKVTNTIRRASKDAQTLKAGNFQIKDDEGNNIESFMLQIFKHHINDRFPDAGQIIQDRLANAMLLRRKRILYRRSRADHGTQPPLPSTDRELSVVMPAAGTSEVPNDPKGNIAKHVSASVVQSKVHSATTLDQERFRNLSSSLSVVSESKTVAFQSHETLAFPPPPGSALRRKQRMLLRQKSDDQANVRGGDNNQGTEGPMDTMKMDEMGEVTCPYCLEALPAEEVLDEKRWQLHVKSDLDPYVCLFDTCDRPDELYTHSEQWIRHLHDHTRTWRCSSHKEAGSFTRREEYIKHLQETHTTKLNGTQLATLATRNSRKATRLFDSCVLCGQHESSLDSRIEEHITGHLRSLALKSLPPFHEPDAAPDEFDNESQDSNNRSRAQTRSTLKKPSDWDRSQPLFSDDNDPTIYLQTGSRHMNFLGEAHHDLRGQDVRAVPEIHDMNHEWVLPENDLILQNLRRKKLDQGTETRPPIPPVPEPSGVFHHLQDTLQHSEDMRSDEASPSESVAHDREVVLDRSSTGPESWQQYREPRAFPRHFGREDIGPYITSQERRRNDDVNETARRGRGHFGSDYQPARSEREYYRVESQESQPLDLPPGGRPSSRQSEIGRHHDLHFQDQNLRNGQVDYLRECDSKYYGQLGGSQDRPGNAPAPPESQSVSQQSSQKSSHPQPEKKSLAERFRRAVNWRRSGTPSGQDPLPPRRGGSPLSPMSTPSPVLPHPPVIPSSPEPPRMRPQRGSVSYDHSDYELALANDRKSRRSLDGSAAITRGSASLEDDNVEAAIRYQDEFVNREMQVPLTEKILREANKQAGVSKSRSRRSSASHDDSDHYKRSTTTGLTHSSGGEPDDYKIKVSGAAIVRASGLEIEYDGGEITFSAPSRSRSASDRGSTLSPQIEDAQLSNLSGSVIMDEEPRKGHKTAEKRLMRRFQRPSSAMGGSRIPFPNQQPSLNNTSEVEDKTTWVTESFPEYHLDREVLEGYLIGLFKDAQITVESGIPGIFEFEIPRPLTKDDRDDILMLRWTR